jgi:uncharacterized protein DUF3455
MSVRYSIIRVRACHLSIVAAGAIVLGLSSTARAQSAHRGGGAPPVPPNLEVPAGFSPFLEARAAGTQNYVCLPTTSGVSWKFIAPEATLFDTFKGEIRQLATHFLSANPAENGVPRPTWQHSFDSSRVWGRAVASSSDANFVAPGAIPWLLLEAVGVSAGPAGGFTLAPTAFLQRLNTSGGTAPATGCSLPSDIGALALVPYTADYVFYRAHRDN